MLGNQLQPVTICNDLRGFLLFNNFSQTFIFLICSLKAA